MANESSLSPHLSAEAQMNTLRWGFVTTQAIAVAARLGLADLVAAAPKTVEELARETRTHAPSLHRLLQFLASLAIFEEDAAGKYRQTALSETLRKDAPRTLRAATIFLGWTSFGNPGEICGRQSLRGNLRSTACSAQLPLNIWRRTRRSCDRGRRDDFRVLGAAFRHPGGL